MPPRPHRPEALAWQVFRGSDAVRDGLLTEHQLRSAAWVRVRHDVYADARLDRDHALACRAVLLRLPPGVIVGGPSAAYLHGVEHAAAFTDDVHVLVPRPLRVGAQRGLRVHVGVGVPSPETSAGERSGTTPGSAARVSSGNTRATGPGDGRMSVARLEPVRMPDTSVASSAPGREFREQRGSIHRSDPGRAAWETAVWLDPIRAVTIVDTMLGQGLTDSDTLAEMAARNADSFGARRARWIFGLADGGAQSPPESQLRVRLVLGGLPRPAVQHPVRLPKGIVLHPNLAWPEYRVAVEYDGQWHADAEQLHRDRRRLNLLVGAGWLVLHVTSRRLHVEFPAVLREVRAALVARGWRR
ncbi:hypothetical protein ADK66_12145 [Micromonospora sp. NRRL B-16802]|uniref:hypothetical protein n=1 Tax=Micromonospora sp. NRRL B-16802 TaxID=1415541 RepID=UPI0006AF9A45|nr:hypothetical protein [Micromonospora sp. NRRL B-16802]KOX09473.1 hypothetical protein ADK66_12145 [Micromonospora sp. NRRL B-16802]